MTSVKDSRVPFTEAATRLFGDLSGYLTIEKYNFEARPESLTLFLAFAGSQFEVKVIIFCGDGYLVFQAVLPFTVQHASYELLAYLNELNTEMPIGAFEHNPGRGLVLFRVGMHIPPLLTRSEFVSAMLYTVARADTYANNIYAVIAPVRQNDGLVVTTAAAPTAT